MRVSAPPFLNPCYYGTDIDSRDTLIACNHTHAEMEKMIGVDSLGFLNAEHLCMLIGTKKKCGYCSACFDGDYPTDIPKQGNKNRFEEKIGKSEKEDQE